MSPRLPLAGRGGGRGRGLAGPGWTTLGPLLHWFPHLLLLLLLSRGEYCTFCSGLNYMELQIFAWHKSSYCLQLFYSYLSVMLLIFCCLLAQLLLFVHIFLLSRLPAVCLSFLLLFCCLLLLIFTGSVFSYVILSLLYICLVSFFYLAVVFEAWCHWSLLFFVSFRCHKLLLSLAFPLSPRPVSFRSCFSSVFYACQMSLIVLLSPRADFYRSCIFICFLCLSLVAQAW
jgi:hypothetical protein